MEAAAHQAVEVVDPRAADVEQAGGVNVDPHAVLHVHFVAWALGVFKGHAVLHAAASAALHEHAQAVGGSEALLLQNAAQLLRRRFG